MRLDGKLVSLRVEEKNCGNNCVGPGRSGVVVYRFLGPGVRATFTKTVTCARHAEACGGLPEGIASVAVSTSAGRTVTSVWGEYCDR